MALDFNSAHKAYADAVMTAEAHKAFGKRGPSAAAAKKASWNSSVAADKAARGKEKGYAKSWSTATANSINQAIEGAAKTAIKATSRCLSWFIFSLFQKKQEGVAADGHRIRFPGIRPQQLLITLQIMHILK